MPHSGWPFTRAHLDPFYQWASDICGIGSIDYSADGWEEKLSRRIEFPDGNIKTTMFKFGPSARFFREGREALESVPNVYLYANVVEIEVSENAAEVVELRVATLEGSGSRIRAKRYILAAGAIENARLLLASNRVASKGLGNGHDVVGRYSMDRSIIRTGLSIPL